jgi:uncharacterized protein (TIGR02145 family)
MKKIIVLAVGLMVFTFKTQAQATVTDFDENVYTTVEIGTQIWMAENLKVTHYADGTIIPYITDNSQWGSLGDNETDDAFCYYENDANGEATAFGALYSWAAAMGDNAVSSNAVPSGVQGVCPDGWHLPSNAEWTILQDYLIANGYNFDGSTSGNEIAKSLAATSGWTANTTAGNPGNDQTSNNSTGFTAFAGGTRSNASTGIFTGIESKGIWWSSTEYATDNSMSYRSLIQYNYDNFMLYFNPKSNGFSVRCLSNSSVSIGNKKMDEGNRHPLYPNPASNMFYIDNTDSKSIVVQICNILGECVLQTELNNTKNGIDVNALPNGIYIVKLKGDNWQEQSKFIKE